MASRRGTLSSVIALGMLGALGSVDASAHGGQFRGPSPQTPPGLQPPSDPIQGLWDANLDALVAEDGVGPVTTGRAADADAPRRRPREDKVVPFLRSVIAGKHGNDSDLIAAAALALAKTTAEPTDVERILALSDDPSRPTLLRESAALAPGLLRRTDKALRFEPALLDRVRARCLDVFDGGTHASRRTRCMAMLAIGLLGDQPTAADRGDAPAGLDLGRELASRLRTSSDLEEQVALVVALGLQARAAVAADTLDALRHLASTGIFAPRERPVVVQCHAMVALARIAGADASGVLLRFVRAPRTDAMRLQAAMSGLGVIATRLPPLARTAAAGEIAIHADRGNPDTVGLALLTLGRLFAAATRDANDRTTLASPAAELLLRQIEDGPGDTRSIAALATGFALRPGPPASADRSCVAFRRQALAALTAADDEKTDPTLRGAVLLALGLSHDVASIGRLTTLVGRRDVDVELRARAATALGLVGDRSGGPLDALRAAMDPRSPDGVRREAARALGFLGDASALPHLLGELRGEQPDTVRARAAVALGALRRPMAVDPLIALASDRSAPDLARAIAVAALGLLTDPEAVRSLSLLGTDLGGMAISDALGQAMSLL